MLIKVGTNNKVKVLAVKKTILDYPSLMDAEVVGASIRSRVRDQPLSLNETLAGAYNRALGALQDGADLGIGIESGLMHCSLGHLNVAAAVVCEKASKFFLTGKEEWLVFESTPQAKGFHFGFSTAFPLPNPIVDRILYRKMELDTAVFDAKLAEVADIGKTEGGFIGMLTQGRLSRVQYSMQALQMALVSYENKEMFKEARRLEEDV